MKHSCRILILLVCMALMMSSFSSCFVLIRGTEMMEQMGAEVESAAQTSQTDSDLNENADPKEKLVFSLTNDDYDSYLDQLSLCEELVMEGTQTLRIAAAVSQVEEMYYHIYTQSQIAYILYCCDLDDEQLSDDYLYASAISAEAYTEYALMCQRIDQSDSPYRDSFFEGWTEADLEDMRSYSEEYEGFTVRNDELLVEYRELSEEEFESKTPELYLELVKNNNALAKAMGYDNYYECAYLYGYARDFGTQEVTYMRNKARQMSALIKRVYENFESGLNDLSMGDYNRLVKFLERDYDDVGKDYLSPYIQDAPKELREAMEEVLYSGNAIFTDSSKAQEGAFTAYLYDLNTPFCYFGPGYQNTMTVIHEMGHYYAATQGEIASLDLAELHSQGNEYLFLAYAKQVMDEDVYEVLVDYTVYEQLATFVLCCIIDEFEEYVYTNADIVTAEHLEGGMQVIAKQYGGLEFVEEYIADVNMYWRYVTFESPVYYISYATSGISALGLFIEAEDSLADAQALYKKIVEISVYADGFCSAIAEAELFSPFESEIYAKLQARYGKR